MANCPHCAERIGLRARFAADARCPHCGLALRLAADGTIMTWAREHGPDLLERPRDRRYWSLFGLGAIAAVVCALIPSGGLLTGTLLFLIQTFCLQRAHQRFKEHYTLLHNLTSDVYGALMMMIMLASQVVANALLGPISVAIVVPVYVVVWFLYDLYVRAHFRRLTQGRRPSAVELAGIAVLMATVTLPPTALCIVLLTSVLG